MPAAETIVAIATAPGRGGIGVVRVSGKTASTVAAGIIGKPLQPRVATLANFLDGSGEVIDQGIALFFTAPHSFTGEDVLELQGHGGPAVLQLVLQRCLALGARLAQPGEFTRRAFLNDKLDLAQAESVADLIDAASAEAARSAIRSLQGVFSQAVHRLVDGLINLRMLVEATLDFPDEEIDFLEAAGAKAKLKGLQEEAATVLGTARQGNLLREGMHVVLIGQPNVGKSSLLNQLAGDEVAIVTAVAGTTRDTIRQEIDLDGVPVHVIDTAGLRETADEVEQIGISRTWQAIQKANLALLLLDAGLGLGDSDRAILARLPQHLPVVRVYNKIDLSGEPPGLCSGSDGVTEIHLSARTGAGVDALRRHLLDVAGWQPSGEGAFMARERHLRALKSAASHLQDAGEQWQALELFAEELKLAQNALNEITGEFGADELLGEIFSRFCIGK
jgi:tRNA modification GTPase